MSKTDKLLEKALPILEKVSSEDGVKIVKVLGPLLVSVVAPWHVKRAATRLGRPTTYGEARAVLLILGYSAYTIAANVNTANHLAAEARAVSFGGKL